MTGSQKTECAAVAQSYYGPSFNGRNLPANWSSTANSLEKIAFLVKDAVLVIDDFCPQGTPHDIQRFHREADRVLRGAGNQAGRQRMKADGSLRLAYRPRGLIICTGEDIPQGHSLRSRMVVVEVKKGDVNLDRLTVAQQYAAQGVYAKVMAAYLRWLAPRMSSLQDSLPGLHAARLTTFRKQLSGTPGAHDRTPDNQAHLSIGFEMFLHFAHDAGALAPEECDRYRRQCQEVLVALGKTQSSHQIDEDPVRRFLQLLSAALVNGRAHLASRVGQDEPDDPELWGWRRQLIGTGSYEREEWRPQGERVGWVSEEDIYLEPDAAFAAVQRLAREQGASLPITKTTLWKRMEERKLLASTDFKRQRNTVRVTIDGVRRAVIHLKVTNLLETGWDDIAGQKTAALTEVAPLGDQESQSLSASGSCGAVGPVPENKWSPEEQEIKVLCSACIHFQPDDINPGTGHGSCRIPKMSKKPGLIFPLKPQRCKVYQAADTCYAAETSHRIPYPTDPTVPIAPSGLNQAGQLRADIAGEPGKTVPEG